MRGVLDHLELGRQREGLRQPVPFEELPHEWRLNLPQLSLAPHETLEVWTPNEEDIISTTNVASLVVPVLR